MIINCIRWFLSVVIIVLVIIFRDWSWWIPIIMLYLLLNSEVNLIATKIRTENNKTLLFLLESINKQCNKNQK